MALDLPRVEYSKTSSDGKSRPSTSPIRISPNDEALKRQKEANERAKNRRQEPEWTKMKLSDLPANTQDNTNTHG